MLIHNCHLWGERTAPLPVLLRNAVHVGKTANTQGDRKEKKPAVKAVKKAA